MSTHHSDILIQLRLLEMSNCMLVVFLQVTGVSVALKGIYSISL